MSNVTAQMVNELRSKTGQGMMECKKALTETGGDVEKAIEYFRKKGVKTSITERLANEGRVHVASSPDRKTAVAVVVHTNTDFTAKSEIVGNVLRAAADKLLANVNARVEDDAAVKDHLTSAAQQTGENVQIGRTASLNHPGGIVATYIYKASGKIAVLMSLTGNTNEDPITQLGGHIAFARPLGLTRDEVPQDVVAKEREIAVLMSLTGTANEDMITQLGGHIAFARPLGLTRDEVPHDVVAKEREIAVEQAKATGKPQQIAEKIAEGKLNSFFAERVLLDQEFFNPQLFKGSVANYLKQHGVVLEKYVRIEVGQS
jgi:elongation factor Ts